MAIVDRIITAEGEFLNENIDPAKHLILSPGGYAELFQNMELEDNTSYEGLIVSVTNNDNVIDFELA